MCHTALVIYNIVFAIVIIVPILSLIDAVGDVQTILILFCLAEIGFATLAVLFVPKLLQYKATQVDTASESSSSEDGYSFDFIPLETISTATQLGAYIAALQRHMDEARKAMQKYKSAAAANAVSPTGSSMNGRPQTDSRQSVSTGPVAALDTTPGRNSSPSIRSSSRVQQQPNSDTAHNWRLGDSKKVAWTPPRSSRSRIAGNTSYSEQVSPQQRRQQQQTDVQQAVQAVEEVDGSTLTSLPSLQPSQPQPDDEAQSSRGASVRAAL